MEKILITPVITPGGIPSEFELTERCMNGSIIVHGGEGSSDFLRLHEGAPEHFHASCRRLVSSVSEKAHTLLVGGITGEGVNLGIRQWEALMRSVLKASTPEVPLMACILGREDMMREQVSIANELGCDKFVLGLNHLGENKKRFDILKSALGMGDKVWLYNMPTFEPASLQFIKECMEDGRVQGIKDSSRGSSLEKISELLKLREIRPDFQVFVGNESVYAELPIEDFAGVDGLVSGNSNVDPELLYNFTQNPGEYESARQSLHDKIAGLTSGDQYSPAHTIERNILGLKRQLHKLGILEGQQVYLYRKKRGELFQPNTD